MEECKNLKPFEGCLMPLDTFIIFPKLKEASVAGVGGETPPKVFETHQTILKFLQKLNLKVEDRNFKPHFTLVRFRESLDLRTMEIPKVKLRLTLSAFTLFESHLGEGPTKYSPLFRLGH